MYWHIDTDIVCIIVLIIMYIDISRTDYSTVKQDNLFKFIIAYTIVVTITDVLSSIVLMVNAPWIVSEVVTAMYYCLAPGVAALWFYYTYLLTKPRLGKKNKVFMAICAVPYVAYLLVSFNNPFTGWIFELTDDLEFSRGPWFNIGIAVYAFYGALVCLTVIVKSRSIVPKGNIGILLSCPVIAGSALVLQFLFQGLLLVSAAYTTVFLITYIFIENRRILADGLTGVYLRQSGEQQITDAIRILKDRKKGVFVLSDIDNFKNINDQMGHAFGDTALKEMARTFRTVLPDHSIISRFGGDEFVVFKEIKEKDKDISEYLDEIRDILAKRVRIEAQNGGEYGMTISTGIANFPAHGETLRELYDHADKAMRFAKGQGKSRDAVYSE